MKKFHAFRYQNSLGGEGMNGHTESKKMPNKAIHGRFLPILVDMGKLTLSPSKKREEVIKAILAEMDKNTLYTLTIRQMADKLKTSLSSVQSVIIFLQDVGFLLKKSQSCFALHPGWASAKNHAIVVRYVQPTEEVAENQLSAFE